MLVMCERTLVAVVECSCCCREDSSSYQDIIFRNSIARIFAVGTTVGSLLLFFFLVLQFVWQVLSHGHSVLVRLSLFGLTA